MKDNVIIYLEEIEVEEIRIKAGGKQRLKKRKTTEDYLKTIYLLSEKGEVRGVDIARELGVTKPTVCVSLRELENEGYLNMTQERTVILTESGKAIAEETLERNVTFQKLLLVLCQDLVQIKMRGSAS